MGLSNPLHLAFIAAIALIVLGPKRMPDLARSIGNGLRELREAISGEAAHRENGETIEAGPSVFAESAAPVEEAAGAEPWAGVSAAGPAGAAPTPAEQGIAAPKPAEQRIAAPTPAEQELAAPGGRAETAPGS
jgi:TatA/E family protein of Tat protein translocase